MKQLYFIYFFWALEAFSAQAATILSPNTDSGNSLNTGPFLLPESSFSMRYQQVFAASDFLPLRNSGGGFITQIAFRLDSSSPGFIGTIIPDIQVNISSTLKAPDGLSGVFSENVGANDTVVFQRGSLAVAGIQSGTIGYFINFQTPFFYDAAPGHNLLLDVKNYQGGYNMLPLQSFSFMDAQDVSGDGVSRVYSYSVNSATAEAVDTIGLVTQFTYTPVPEPSAAALFIFGLARVLICSRVLGKKTLSKRKEWLCQ
jgi:hypothetical protein